MFLIQFYKFVLFLKSITKFVKHCNENDEIKACVVELEAAFSWKTEQRNSYMGPIWAFLGKTIWDMPISALNGTGVDIRMWVYPEWSQMGHT